MTIERWCLLGALCLAPACGASVSNRTADQLDPSGYPPDIRTAYEVFAVRCSRCHTLARPLNARIKDDRHWVRYVNRMRMQPGSGISPKHATEILRFLRYYAEQLRREDVEAQLPIGELPSPAAPGPSSFSPPAPPPAPATQQAGGSAVSTEDDEAAINEAPPFQEDVPGAEGKLLEERREP